MVAEGRVEDPALAIVADPGHGEVAVSAMDVGALEVDFGFVKASEDADAFAGEVLYLVDFVQRRECGGKVAHGGVGAVLHDDGGFEGVPGVAVEVATDHFPIFGPLVVGVDGTVAADEAFAVFLDEGEREAFCSSSRSSSPVVMKKTASK